MANRLQSDRQDSRAPPTGQSDVQPSSGRSHHAANARGSRVHGGVNGFGASYGTGPPTIKKEQKHVLFQLIDTADPRIQARLPMRVMISQHDNTESIITTVKNFYGLYDQDGVSFENKEGISIIAAYDNFDNDMVVYVRTVAQPSATARENGREPTSPKKPTLGAPIELRTNNSNFSPSRSAIRSAGRRSTSPQSDMDRRSMSTVSGVKPRTLRTKSKDNSVAGDADGYSSGDNGGGSVTSSRRSKTEQVNAEISVDNIVEGGRRKRAFESSELPLFVPPQVPITTSVSSVSPQRRIGPVTGASPYSYLNQQTFSYTQPLPSPQSFGTGSSTHNNGHANGYSHGHQSASRFIRGGRQSINYYSRNSMGGIIPTPDPTINSVISDEDVALQLMRLGDPAAFSHGRTSTSTVDDAFSGKADAASSEEEDDNEDEAQIRKHHSTVRSVKREEGPQRKKHRPANDLPSEDTNSEGYDDLRDDSFRLSDGHTESRKNNKSKSVKHTSHVRPQGIIKPKTQHGVNTQQTPMSPSSLPAHSRKPSVASTINFQHQLADDEEDLSSKPRCQRCRKSKKGCDRQRPCGRCKDAGIGIEGCVSEDEGNGRKGRYGRHMGVPVKKGDEGVLPPDESPAPAMPPTVGLFIAPAIPDKNKKRKR